MSNRLIFLKKLTERLSALRYADGYNFDLCPDARGLRVVRGRISLGQDEPTHMVSIIEPPVAVEPERTPEGSRASVVEWDLLIQGWARDTRDTRDALGDAQPCDGAYLLSDDVRRLLHIIGAEMHGGPTPPASPYVLGVYGMVSIKVGSPVVRPTEDVTGYGVFYLPVTINTVETFKAPTPRTP